MFVIPAPYSWRPLYLSLVGIKGIKQPKTAEASFKRTERHWEAFLLVCKVFPWQNIWIERKDWPIHPKLISSTRKISRFVSLSCWNDSHSKNSLLFLSKRLITWKKNFVWEYVFHCAFLALSISCIKWQKNHKNCDRLAFLSPGWSKQTARPCLRWPSIAQLVDQSFTTSSDF